MTNNYPGIGYKTQGRDYNFYQKIPVTATTFGGSSVDGYQPDTIITFSTQSVMFLNEGAGTVEVSFNGVTVHDTLSSTNASAGIVYDNRVISMIWLRVQAGSSGPINVSIRAWGIR
jgi:hypothetical protein